LPREGRGIEERDNLSTVCEVLRGLPRSLNRVQRAHLQNLIQPVVFGRGLAGDVCVLVRVNEMVHNYNTDPRMSESG
jgi:hypothetical protein